MARELRRWRALSENAQTLLVGSETGVPRWHEVRAFRLNRTTTRAVAARGADQRAAGREREHVLLALVLERARRRVHAGAGLELPELLAGRRVERGEAPVVAADEQQPAAGRERAAVALLGPLVCATRACWSVTSSAAMMPVRATRVNVVAPPR